MCISNNAYKNYKLDLDSLAYSKSFEEEMEEQKIVATAEAWFNARGIKVKTKQYGYYRNIWDVLKDFGKWLSENDSINADLLYLNKMIKPSEEIENV